MKRIGYLLFASLLLAAGCGKDSITVVDSETIEDYNDVDFDQTVTVVYSPTGNATVSGTPSDFTVSIDGNGVTIVYTGSEEVQYNLTGSSSNGYFKLYSPTRQAVMLQSLTLTNPNGPALNLQGPTASPSSGPTTYVVLDGASALADGATYAQSPSDEDQKGVVFAEGPLVFSGDGSVTVTATGKSGIASDDVIQMSKGTVTVNASSAVKVNGTDTLKVAGMKAKDGFSISDGTLTISCSGTGCKGLTSDGDGTFAGGMVTITVTGANFGSSSLGGGPGGGPGGGQTSSDVPAKGIKFDGNVVVKGGTLIVSSASHEGIEAKGTLTVSDGQLYSYSATDDAINAGGDMTISGGYVCAHAVGNDGLDANGNCYIKGGVVYAIGASSPEVAIDANSEEGKKLYVQGGTIIAIGGLERGASLTQSCYQASSWSRDTWYALTVGSTVYAFKTPSSGGTPLVVSGASTPTLKSGVTASGGTDYFNGMMQAGGTVSGGSNVSLTSYTANSGGGPGWH